MDNQPPASVSSTVEEVVAELRAIYERDEKQRAAIVEVRDKASEAARVVQRHVADAHLAPDSLVCATRAIEALRLAGKELRAVERCIAPDDYFRYNDMWRRTLQECVCAAIVAYFLLHDKLADKAMVIDMLRARAVDDADADADADGERPMLPLDDYLLGACSAMSELARMCMNRVTVGDYKTPARCAAFGAALYDAFKLLNFRNDLLRKRFDGIKYDVKRMEEVTYDMAIRGLLPKEATTKGDVSMRDAEENGAPVVNHRNS